MQLLKYFFVFCISCYIGIQFGKYDVKTRAKESPVKECYTHQELEYIVFGTIQE